VRGHESCRPCEGGMAVLYPVAPVGGGEPGLLKLSKLEFGNHPVCYAGFEVEQMILGRVAGPHVPRRPASADFCCLLQA